jgi:hypothetical protein
VQSSCNFPIENYTEIFYAIYKLNVPPIKCKMGQPRVEAEGTAIGKGRTGIEALSESIGVRRYAGKFVPVLS